MAVSVEEAFEIIYNDVKAGAAEIVPIEQALGRVISQDVVARYNLPPYDNSAMDGYAVLLGDAGKCTKVPNTIFAGDAEEIKIFEGSCAKIMTGARIPQGCESIVPIENTTACEAGVLLPQNLKAGQHIRLCGEDIQSDDMLIERGTRLFAHHITLLASQGITHVQLFKKPRVALFASGSELKMHFEQVEAYQLYNTNTPTFSARARELGCDVSFTGTPEDSLDAIRTHVRTAMDADLIITSGGVSVGDADYTREAFAMEGFEALFEHVNIKPGKPTTFGRIGKTFVLNLPGNPLAAAMNFELFAQAIILALSGQNDKYLSTIAAVMAEDYTMKPGRRTLVPGDFDGETFTPCEKFAPGMISPLSRSNSFIMIDESVEKLPKASRVKIIPIRHGFYRSAPIPLSTLA